MRPRNPQKAGKLIKLSAYVEETVYKQLVEVSIKEDRSLSQTLTHALKIYLKTNDNTN